MPMTRSSFTRLCWVSLAFTILVILWGAFVRATGAGAGCGSHWPLCNGEVIPRAESVETLIEFSHRVTSGIAFLFVLAVAILARRVFPRGHRVRRVAMIAFVLMVLEAGIGAGLVLFELVADNQSMARALFMAVHLGNTFLLLAAMTLTAHWSGGGRPVRLDSNRHLRNWMAGCLLGTLLIGMSGAVAALGDTLFPASSLQEALSQDLSPTSHVLIHLRKYHPLIAVFVSLAIFSLISRIRDRRPGPETRRWVNRLNVLLLVQLTAGAANILLLAPVFMQILHLLLADALWICLVVSCASALAEEPRTASAAAAPDRDSATAPEPLPS